jgi:hypothetical protein
MSASSAACALSRYGDCDSIIELHHVIPKQRLKQRLRISRGDPILLDPRNLIPLCRRHHHLVTIGFIKVPVWAVDRDVWDFADEHGLRWSLERDLI